MNTLEEIIAWLMNSGPELFTIMLCIVGGYVLRMIPKFPNNWIPLVCVLIGPTLYPLLTNPGRVSPDAHYPMVRIIGTGLILGVAAFILHDKLIRHVEDKLPFLKGILSRADARTKESQSKRYRKRQDGTIEEIPPAE